jgi:hypothetical protein
MLYVATVHYQSPRWIELQTRRLREHLSVPHQIWTSLEGIDPSYGKHFDRVVEQYGDHAGKLNHLALEIRKVASDDDLLMFLDGDAFPVADPMPMIAQNLESFPLIAVRRVENVDEPQPHPSFCVTTVGTWRKLPGDWSMGYPWTGPRGNRDTDVGGNLLRALELTETPWLPLLRTGSATDHPLFFGTYGDLVYHHGAGFREGVLTRVDRDGAPRPVPLSEVAVMRPFTRPVNSLRWRSWERREKRRSARESQAMYRRIQGR